jgi:geranylgeranyl pyrophosphate synthase
MKTVSFTDIQSQCGNAVESALDRFFERSSSMGVRKNSEMSRYHMSTGGKRLRALIPSWVYAAYGRDPLTAVSLGCAVEMVHNATLVHDDLQDGDQLRRGLATVWKKYSEAQAINCGDAMFQFAFQILCELDLEPSSFRRMALRLTQATLLVIEGQAQEFLMKDELNPGYERYLEVVQGKTATLISAAVTCAMEALGLPEEVCERARIASLNAGVLFQIQDDVLDVYGDKKRDRPATDIAEGKISALVALLNEAAKGPESARVSAILRLPREQTTDAHIGEVLGMFEKYGIRNAALQKIRAIQSSSEKDPVLLQHPEIHGLIVEMNQLFLRPIQHLL